MHHERIHADDGWARVDVTAAVRPATTLLAPVLIIEIGKPIEEVSFVPTPAAPDVPGSAGAMIAIAARTARYR